MIPYADFTYFVLLLYVAVPTVILGLFGRAGWRWAFLMLAPGPFAGVAAMLALRRLVDAAKMPGGKR